VKQPKRERPRRERAEVRKPNWRGRTLSQW
jgi:hypothetical protein